MRMSDFAQRIRERKPEYSHLNDVDLVQMVSQKKPELLSNVDKDELRLTLREITKKEISRERQKTFKSLSGFSRFGTGVEHGLIDTFMGIKQLFSGQLAHPYMTNKELSQRKPQEDSEIDKSYKEYKGEYQDASKGDFASGAGELAGSLIATAPIPGATGAKIASKVASPLVKTAIKLGTGAAVGGGMGASEYVDEGESRGTNALYGALFGAGGMGAGLLAKKIGAKAANALKGKMADAGEGELIALFEKHGIPYTESMITGKGKNTESALEGLGIVGTGGFMEKGSKKVQEVLGGVKQKINPNWDEELKASLSRKASTGRDVAKKNYENIAKLAGDVTVNPDNSINITKMHIDQMSKGVTGADTGPLKTILKNLETGERTFDDLKNIRSELGEQSAEAYKAGKDNLGRRLKEIRLAVEYDMDDLVKGKVKGTATPNFEDVQEYEKALNPNEQYNTAMDFMQNQMEYENWNNRMDGFGEYKNAVQKMANFVKMNGHKKNKNGMLISEHIPASYFGQSSDDIATRMDMTENEFMEMLSELPKKPTLEVPKYTKNLSSQGLTPVEKSKATPPKEGLMEAYNEAQSHYKNEVVPYKASSIRDAIKTATPDELFEKFIKPKKGDRAANFYALLDEKGRRALRDGFLDNALKGATKNEYTSPAQFAGYIERMADPAKSIFKGKEFEELKGLAKVMKHAERYGQINENPSNGNRLIPFLKGGTLAGGIGAGLMANPAATGATVLSSAALTKLLSLMKTKGVKFSLASSEIGSEKMEKAITKLLEQLPKTSAVAGKELGE